MHRPHPSTACLQVTDGDELIVLRIKPGHEALCDAWDALQRVASRAGAERHIVPSDENTFPWDGPSLTLGCITEDGVDIQFAIFWHTRHGELNGFVLLFDGRRWSVARCGDATPPHGIEPPFPFSELGPDQRADLPDDAPHFDIADDLCRAFLAAIAPN